MKRKKVIDDTPKKEKITDHSNDDEIDEYSMYQQFSFESIIIITLVETQNLSETSF